MKQNAKRKGTVVLIGTVSFVACILIVYMCIALYYKKHIFPNTRFGDIKLSGCTAEDAEDALNGVLSDYKLTISERGKVSEEIHRGDIDLKYALDGYGEKLTSGQNIFSWPYHCFKKTVIDSEFDITYDENKLRDIVDKLACMQQKNVVMPQDASVSEYSSGEGFCVIDEVMGTLIDRDKFINAIEECLKKIDTDVNIEESGCYINPKLYSDDEKLVKQADYLNRFVSTRITYHFGDTDEVVNGDTVYSWMNIKKNGKVKIDESKLMDYVNKLGSTYDTIFRPRMFMTTYGKEVEIKDGDYGWWMDRNSEVKELIKLVKKGTVTEREPAYFQKAAQYGSQDYGNTYVEVNLTAQHLYLYKEGKLFLESDFVSGKNTKDRKTNSGVFGVTYKERDATLTGEDYETPVSYWMPFNGSIGLHDATWRSKFGSSFYKAGGSHGCVNLPFYVAEKIYENIEEGTAVICYELPGTESSSVTLQGDEEIAEFVVDAIDRIGKIVKTNMQATEKTLTRIRKCYSELSSNQKKCVTNLGKLEKAEKDFNELK